MSLVRNTSWNMAGALYPTLLALFVLPIYLETIGLERYGVLSIAFVILGYFGFFDLGLTRATSHRIAQLRDATPEERSDVVWTALAMNGVLAILGALLVAPAAILYFSHGMPLEGSLKSEAVSAALWLSLALPVSLLSGVLGGALQGRERFAELNLANMLSVTVLQLAPLAAAKFIGPELHVVLPATILSQLLLIMVLGVLARMHVPMKRPRQIGRPLANRLLAYGGWISISAIVGPLLDFFDRIAIGTLHGAAAVTYYVVPKNLVGRTAIPARALANALFPRLAAASSEDRSNQLHRLSTLTVAALLTPALLVLAHLLHPFIAIWIDAEFAVHAAPVAIVLLVGVWANCLAQMPFALLQARGRPDLVAKLHLAELIPYVIAVAFLTWQFGILGMAIAWSARAAGDAILLAVLTGPEMAVLRPLCLPFFLILSNAALLLAFPSAGLFVSAAGGVLTLVSLVWAYIHCPPVAIRRLPLARYLGLAK